MFQQREQRRHEETLYESICMEFSDIWIQNLVNKREKEILENFEIWCWRRIRELIE